VAHSFEELLLPAVEMYVLLVADMSVVQVATSQYEMSVHSTWRVAAEVGERREAVRRQLQRSTGRKAAMQETTWETLQQWEVNQR
jgi:hypothetical protein